jgi:predicted dehydrogenase
MMKFGIAGAGIRGELFAQSLAPMAEATLVAVCDLIEDRAVSLATRFGARAFSDYRAMLNDADLDALVVATPDFAHRDVAVAGARRGLHLLIEKPLATTLEDAYEIREAVERAAVRCMVGFENRWHPAFVHARKLAAEGQLGDVLTQNIVLSNTYHVPTKMPGWSAQSSPGWFLMSHTVDLALWLSGKKLSRLYAQGSRGVLKARGIDTWDVIHALLTFEDGTIANLTSSWVLPDASPSIAKFQYQAIGERSAIAYDLQGHALQHTTANRYRSVALVGGQIDGLPQGPPVWMLWSFVRRLAEGAAVAPAVEDGVRVTEIIVAIHESLRDGAPRSLQREAPTGPLALNTERRQ